jgi:hypothetical protein
MDTNSWAWPVLNQLTIDECELVLYAIIALYHQYTTVGVPRFRRAKETYLTNLDVLQSLDNLYTLDKTGSFWQAIVIATHSCCPNFDKTGHAVNNWFAVHRNKRKVKKTFRDTWFSEQWKAKLTDAASFTKLSAHLDQAIQSLETNSQGQGNSEDAPASLDLKPFLAELNREVLQLVGAHIPTTYIGIIWYVTCSVYILAGLAGLNQWIFLVNQWIFLYIPSRDVSHVTVCTYDVT